MPPKAKVKKGKKGDDEDFWANAGESAAGAGAPEEVGKDDSLDVDPPPKKAVGFAGLEVAGGEDDEDDQDNFMAMLQKRKGKKKEKKGAPVEHDDTAMNVDESLNAELASKAPKEMTAEDLADEEWGPVKEKGKKKKGKDKKSSATPADDIEDAPEKAKGTPSTAAVAAPDAGAGGDASDGEDDGTGSKVLSKKEKEKLKKEKEKAKKKAQAAAKKAQGGGGDEDNEPKEKETTTAPDAPSAAQENDEDAADAADAAAKKKKNRKKKGKKDEDEDDAPAPTPAPAAPAGKGKKGPAGLSALKAALEQKRLIEEETKRKIEEEKRRIEEEERLAAEEAQRKEEEKQRRKEKEKVKKEQARKEGRLLTDKQRKEKQAAEIRRQALLQSGAVIEGLTKKDDALTAAPKKVVYGKRQRGPAHGAAAPGSVAASSAPSTPLTTAPKELEPEPEVSKPAVAPAPAQEQEEEEPDWDASTDDEKEAKKEGEDVKDDWDASSGDEEKKAAAKPAPKVEGPKAKCKHFTPEQAYPNSFAANGKPTTATTPATKAQAPSKPGASQTKVTAKSGPSKPSSSKAPAPPESSSEEESSNSESESDSDDDSGDSEDESSSDDGLTTTKRMEAERKAAAAARRQQREAEAKAAASKDNLRSPICCILGHVDTGKTKLLDKIRQTNVQEGEAGGITQQIGATYFPVDAIRTKTAVVNKDGAFEFKIPGLLIIDTPGHESFTNLRSRGSSLCNIAILVVDIMHGLEPQTIESLNLLKNGSTPFIIALNKIDRLYSWKATPDNGVQDSLAEQNSAVQREFNDRASKCILQIAEQGLNCELYWKNTNPRRIINIVPTSAITGEGIPDMIKLLVDLTQTRMVNSLMYISTLECTVLEVKVVEGLGTTIDVILSNGYLREGDKIVLCGLNGPIVTQVRALLMPQPLRELRIKSAYIHNKEVKAANGVKVVAPDLEKAIAGSKLLVCGPDDDEDDLIEEVMKPLEDLLKRISKTQTGVHVQASTLGSLEALLSFLETSKIPVSGIQIGPVHKKDVRRAMTQLEKAQEMACILCFDVPVDKEAEKLAEEAGVKLFKADIIYHLFDSFTAYHKEITEAKRKDAAPQAVWPCRLKIIAVFAKRDPIIVGVDILEGTLRVGTPLCVVNAEKQVIKLGRITSLEINHKAMDIVKKSQAGGGVAVKIEHAVYETPKMAGRHFDENDELLSMISRQSIDVLKETFRNDVSKEEWVLIKNLKTRLQIP